MKQLTQHVIRGDYHAPINGSPLISGVKILLCSYEREREREREREIQFFYPVLSALMQVAGFPSCFSTVVVVVVITPPLP